MESFLAEIRGFHQGQEHGAIRQAETEAGWSHAFVGVKFNSGPVCYNLIYLTATKESVTEQGLKILSSQSPVLNANLP